MLEIVKARQPTKVWLNGRLEIVLPGGGNGLAPVRLRRGENLILVKTGRDGFSGITLHPTGPTPLQGVAFKE